ncbi:MAG TPA: disulfide bond formation protein B, partial [Alphaproteobacteria bacterium]|nr:disulfide bond formation protein B [Alphaproteobacteria bacterium]
CAVLLGAYGFEYIGGLRPCTLCYYQRLPYALAIILGFAAFLRPALNRPGLAALTLTFVVSAGLGAYHAGVEQKWWPGPQGCS